MALFEQLRTRIESGLSEPEQCTASTAAVTPISSFVFPCIVVICLSLSGCEQSKKDGAAGKSWGDVADTAAKPFRDIAKEIESIAPGDEFEKLFQFEYKIIEVDRDSDLAATEKTLAEAGRERWDCFHVQNITRPAVPVDGKERPPVERTRFFCKRLPRTLLRFVPYLPRVFF